MHPFADPTAHRRLQRLVTVVYPRGPRVFIELLTDIAIRIGGQAAIFAALEELEVAARRRRRQATSAPEACQRGVEQQLAPRELWRAGVCLRVAATSLAPVPDILERDQAIPTKGNAP